MLQAGYGTTDDAPRPIVLRSASYESLCQSCRSSPSATPSGWADYAGGGTDTRRFLDSRA